MRLNALEASAVACLIAAAGCAHPPARVVPPSSAPVDWAVFAPYLVANFWPHAVKRIDAESFAHLPPAKEGSTLDSAVDLHSGECLGRIYKGHGLITSPDERLIEAGCEAVQTSPLVVDSLAAHLKSAMSAYPADPSRMVGPRLRTLREKMAEAVVVDAGLKAAVCQRFPELIADCPEAGPARRSPSQ